MDPITGLAIAQVGASLFSGIGTAIEGLNQADLITQRGEAMKQFYLDKARMTKIEDSRKAAKAFDSAAVSASARGTTNFDIAYEAAYEINLESAMQQAQLRQQGRLAEFDALMNAQAVRADAITKGIGKVSSAGASIFSKQGVKK